MNNITLGTVAELLTFLHYALEQLGEEAIKQRSYYESIGSMEKFRELEERLDAIFIASGAVSVAAEKIDEVDY